MDSANWEPPPQLTGMGCGPPLDEPCQGCQTPTRQPLGPELQHARAGDCEQKQFLTPCCRGWACVRERTPFSCAGYRGLHVEEVVFAHGEITFSQEGQWFLGKNEPLSEGRQHPLQLG